MMRSSILGTPTMLNVLIQHLPLQSLFWIKIWRAFRASDPSNDNTTCDTNLELLIEMWSNQAMFNIFLMVRNALNSNHDLS